MTSPLEAVRKLNQWEEVPAAVVGLYRHIVDDAFKVAQALDTECGPCARAYIHPVYPDWVYIYDPEADDDVDFVKGAAYERTLGGRTVTCGTLPPFDPGWVLIKSAAFLKPVADTFKAVQAPFGGPNPITHTIVGGLLGSGIGYGGGYLAGRLGELTGATRPGDRTLARHGAVAGGLLGMSPGIYEGVRNMGMPAQTGGGFGAWTSQYPYRPQDLGGPEWRPGMPIPDPGGLKFPKKFEELFRAEGAPSRYPDLGMELEGEIKQAVRNSSGALYLPTIPVDAFNRAVWSDVHRAPNPWGTRDAFGTNDTPMYTPPPVAAAVSGIVAGAGAARDRDYVSPWDVAVTAGITAGKGYLGGLVLGKTLGALAGLRPEVQERIQQVGLWGGLVAGAANELFN